MPVACRRVNVTTLKLLSSPPASREASLQDADRHIPITIVAAGFEAARNLLGIISSP